ncbi:MAG TPA: dynamin family protein [Thermomicrobiales bacterium]|nr:dynamin family protein [Thermomicrobiales bacterium]
MAQPSETILSDRQHDLLGEERGVLDRLLSRMTDFGASADELTLLRRAVRGLDELFLLVIVGEFNSGKSAFINALLGDPVMEEGVTPTTNLINVLRFGPTHATHVNAEGLIEHSYPARFLRDISVVDTPGTNAIIREHEAISQGFVPRSDLILFVTSADRPFSESERAFMQEIREWGKKIVVVLNKIDLLDEPGLAQVEAFIREHTARLLGIAPEIFPIAAKPAERAKALEPGPERDALWAQSRFAPLERYILETLDETSRVRLKLLNPLGVAERVTERYYGVAEERLALLAEDYKTIENIEGQLALYREEMERDFAHYITKIENIILAMNERGLAFFDETLRIGRVFDLLNADKVRAAFEQEVTHDTERQIEATVHELIDWLIERDLKTWTAINDYIGRRQLTKYNSEVIGEVGRGFEYDRRALLASVARNAQDVVTHYDARSEAHQLSQSVRGAVVSTGIAEAGAVGLGALVVAAASTLAVDITGIAAASFIALLGFGILPLKRRRATAQFRERSDALRERLIGALREQFAGELDRSLARMREAVAPYTRFVRAEREKALQLHEELTDIATQLRRLRVGIERVLSDER